MEHYYSSERNIQMLVYLMKQHGIKKVIASPGTTNITFVASLQHDPYFEMYSAADERSAAYMACGLAAESGEPVAITCTGATASRNYIPGLTEAYYRKLPVLAVTSTQHTGRVGQLVPQVIDRSVIQNDIAVMSVDIPSISTEDDAWTCNVRLNDALLALRHRGGGPVHINLHTIYSKDFSVKTLPKARTIQRVCHKDAFPEIRHKRVGIFVGAHRVWTPELTDTVDRFCEKYNGVVICDHTSNYHGKYRILFSLICSQKYLNSDLNKMELLIDIGEMSGAYMRLKPQEVWRVDPDGKVQDRFRKLSYLFDMDEVSFFARYAGAAVKDRGTRYYSECLKKYASLSEKVQELPFSNLWVAKNMAKRLPDDCVVHFGILNSLRSWNYFEISAGISCYCNTGGFGIDGALSTLMGACLANPNKLHFGFVGDLAFFYDMNAIANRHLGRNLRILLINNGCGQEFRNYNNLSVPLGEDANTYIAAAGHYGNKSRTLVKNYAEALGFEYLSSANKSEFQDCVDRFVTPEITDRPILLEVFTNSPEESNALRLINETESDNSSLETRAKRMAKLALGEKGIRLAKKVMKR